MMNRRWYLTTLVAVSIAATLSASPAGAEDLPCKSKCTTSTACSAANRECAKNSADAEHVFYIMECGGCQGDQVTRLHCTGKETVVDALSSIGGFAMHRDKAIWIARPSFEVGDDEILPVNCSAIADGGCATNYAIQPGDRLFVARKVVSVEQCTYTGTCPAVSSSTTECTGRGVNSDAGLVGQVAHDAEVCQQGVCEKAAAPCAKAKCADKSGACLESVCKLAVKRCSQEESTVATGNCSSDKSACCCDGATDTCADGCKCERAEKRAGECAVKCDSAKTVHCQKDACQSTTADKISHPVLDLVDKLDPTTDGIFCPGLAVDVELEISDRRAQLIDVLRELEESEATAAVECSSEQVGLGHQVANPFQADALRQTSSALEHAAAHLEEVELFEQADAVRRLAESLRHESRQAAARLRASFYMSAVPCERE